MKFFTFIEAKLSKHRRLSAVHAQLQSAYRAERAEAMHALVSLHDTRGLCWALSHHTDPYVRRAAVKGLTQLHGAKAARWLVRVLADDDRNLAHTAAECLAGTEDPRVLWALRRCVTSDDALVRFHGASGLARISKVSLQAQSFLEELKDDAHMLVRETALQALRRLTSPTPSTPVTHE